MPKVPYSCTNTYITLILIRTSIQRMSNFCMVIRFEMILIYDSPIYFFIGLIS